MHKHFHIPFKNLKLPAPQHGWRALMGEVVVIVIGVLIALGAETLVQAYHWHEKTEAAEEAMRIEMRDDNAPQLYLRLLLYPCIEGSEAQLLSQSDRLPPDRLRELVAESRTPYNTFDSEAWKAVQASDLANHVDPARLIEWSLPYRLMPPMSALTIQENLLQAELRAALPPNSAPSTADLAKLRNAASQLRTLNVTLATIAVVALQRLDKQGVALNAGALAAIEREARGQYGTCIRHPDLTRNVHVPDVHNEVENHRMLEQLYST